jgi:hypothetical protein
MKDIAKGHSTNAIRLSLATAALTTVAAVSALASQDPGTTGGTATGFEQGLFVAAVAAATCIGLAVLKLRRR